MMGYAGVGVDGDTPEDLQKGRYELESAEAWVVGRSDSGLGCERLRADFRPPIAQSAHKFALEVSSFPISSPASASGESPQAISTSVTMRLHPGQNRNASFKIERKQGEQTKHDKDGRTS